MDAQDTDISAGKVRSFGDILASIVFGIAFTLSILLSGLLLIAAVSSGFQGFSLFSVSGLWAIVVLANPFAILLLRAKNPSAFDQPSNRIFFAGVMLGIVIVQLAISAGIKC